MQWHFSVQEHRKAGWVLICIALLQLGLAVLLQQSMQTMRDAGAVNLHCEQLHDEARADCSRQQVQQVVATEISEQPLLRNGLYLFNLLIGIQIICLLTFKIDWFQAVAFAVINVAAFISLDSLLIMLWLSPFLILSLWRRYQAAWQL